MKFFEAMRGRSGRRRFHRDGVEEERDSSGHQGGHHDAGHRHGHFGRSARGGRPGRVFAQGDLRLLLLHLIAETPRHGYELIRAIEETLQGTYSPSPGIIYPTLTLLEELNYARVESSEGGRKLYGITAEGHAHLATNKAAVDAVLSRMHDASATRISGRAPQILRATENLKLALRLRTSRGALSTNELNTIAQILDEAARAIDQA